VDGVRPLSVKALTSRATVATCVKGPALAVARKISTPVAGLGAAALFVQDSWICVSDRAVAARFEGAAGAAAGVGNSPSTERRPFEAAKPRPLVTMGKTNFTELPKRSRKLVPLLL